MSLSSVINANRLGILDLLDSTSKFAVPDGQASGDAGKWYLSLERANATIPHRMRGPATIVAWELVWAIELFLVAQPNARISTDSDPIGDLLDRGESAANAILAATGELGVSAVFIERITPVERGHKIRVRIDVTLESIDT